MAAWRCDVMGSGMRRYICKKMEQCKFISLLYLFQCVVNLFNTFKQLLDHMWFDVSLKDRLSWNIVFMYIFLNFFDVDKCKMFEFCFILYIWKLFVYFQILCRQEYIRKYLITWIGYNKRLFKIKTRTTEQFYCLRFFVT